MSPNHRRLKWSLETALIFKHGLSDWDLIIYEMYDSLRKITGGEKKNSNTHRHNLAQIHLVHSLVIFTTVLDIAGSSYDFITWKLQGFQHYFWGYLSQAQKH